MATGGALWFPDLTSPDSTWLLPLALGLTNLLIVEVRHGSPTMSRSCPPPSHPPLLVQLFSLQRSDVSSAHKALTNAMRGLSLLMIPIAAGVPSVSFIRRARVPTARAEVSRRRLSAFVQAMALYWWCSSLVGLGHNLLLRAPALRKILKLPARPSNTPYKDLMDAAVRKYRK